MPFVKRSPFTPALHLRNRSSHFRKPSLGLPSDVPFEALHYPSC